MKADNPLQIILDNEILTRAFRYVVENNKSNGAPYHNLHHMLLVMKFCNEGAKYHRLQGKVRNNILVAALFHDFNHTQGKEKDDVNVNLAVEGLKAWYQSNPLNSEVNINRVEDIIRATQYPYVIDREDLTLEQAIIRDADLMICLENDWMNNMIIGLMQEMKIDNIKKMIEGQRSFHKGIEMCSAWGEEVYQNSWNQLFDNLDKLHRLL